MRYQAALRPDYYDYPTGQPHRALALSRAHRKATNDSPPHCRRLTASTIISASAQQKPITTHKPEANCRIAATAVRTRNTGPGFAMDTVTTCSFDRAAKRVTCTESIQGHARYPDDERLDYELRVD